MANITSAQLNTQQNTNVVGPLQRPSQIQTSTNFARSSQPTVPAMIQPAIENIGNNLSSTLQSDLVGLGNSAMMQIERNPEEARNVIQSILHEFSPEELSNLLKSAGLTISTTTAPAGIVVTAPKGVSVPGTTAVQQLSQALSQMGITGAQVSTLLNQVSPQEVSVLLQSQGINIAPADISSALSQIASALQQPAMSMPTDQQQPAALNTLLDKVLVNFGISAIQLQGLLLQQAGINVSSQQVNEMIGQIFSNKTEENQGGQAVSNRSMQRLMDTFEVNKAFDIAVLVQAVGSKQLAEVAAANGLEISPEEIINVLTAAGEEINDKDTPNA